MTNDPLTLLNNHIPVSRETADQLVAYAGLLIKWQNKVNLVGPDTILDLWRRHMLDSLQLAPHLSPGPVMDVGTGAGFPGMALAIYGIPDIHLVESDSKKIAFLREVARLTKTAVTLHHARVEEVRGVAPKTILARAVAGLDELLDLTSPFVSYETTCLFHKGKNYSMELEDASEKWQFDHKIIPSVADTQGVIVQLTNIRRRP